MSGQKWPVKMDCDIFDGFNEISTRYGPIRIILANGNQRKLIQSECTCESISEFMAGHPSGLVQICQKVSRCVRKSICNASILNNVFWLDRSSWDYTVGQLPTVVRVTPDEHICTNQLAFWRLPKRGRSWLLSYRPMELTITFIEVDCSEFILIRKRPSRFDRSVWPSTLDWV